METGTNRLALPGMIGRAPELAQLRQGAADVFRGAGRCMLIAGEAGIGKTRLVSELRAGFQGRSFEGRCYEEEASLPFASLQAGLRTLLRTAGEQEAELIERRRDGLRSLMPDRASGMARRPAPEEPGDPAATQRALFEAVAGLFFDLASRQPLLVVFEDLHWSDASTLAFIRFLARRLDDHRLMLVATYRPDGGSPPLADLLAALTRERHVQQIRLAPFTRSEVKALLDLLFAGPVSSGIVDSVASFAGGNPLYVEELVAAMVREGDIYEVDGAWVERGGRGIRVPDSVQDAVRRRSERLTPGARHLLTLAAVAGQESDFDLLAPLAGLGETDLIASLKELVHAGLITEERTDHFTFRHPLLREAVLGHLLGPERRAVHGQIARALEELYGQNSGSHAAELAHHCYEAGAWERALAFSQRAGEQALALDATREALSQYSRALDCASRLDRQPPLDLLLARAGLYERTGEFEAADADLAAALGEAKRAGLRREMWQALLQRGYLWAARDYERSMAWFQQGLGIAEELGDPLARAETLNRIGNVYLNRDQHDKALPYHEAALAAFGSADNAAGQANTLELMAVCYYNLPDVLAGAACEERALALGPAAVARSVVFHASIHLLLPVRFETEVGPPVDAERLVRLGEEALKWARKTGWAGGEAQALGLLGGFHGLLGQYERGLAYLRESLQIAERLEHQVGIAGSERMVAAVLLELLAFDEAAERLRRARTTASAAGAQFFADLASLALSQVLAARQGPGDLAEATALLSGLPGGRQEIVGRNEREALAVRAELALAQGDAAEALKIVEGLIASTRHLPDRGLRAVPRLAFLLGRALAAVGRPGEARDALEAAVTGAAQLGRRPLLWQAHLALGRLCLDMRQRTEARKHYGSARSIITELAAEIPEPALREAFERQALRLVPPPPAPTSRRTERDMHHGLTERERSVALLAGRGHSNREIAESLVISERTAERHVANILAKLGLASRIELAIWVTENLPSARLPD